MSLQYLVDDVSLKRSAMALARIFIVYDAQCDISHTCTEYVTSEVSISFNIFQLISY